ncbi:hypothetical protein E3N88_45946 [Mikania micrantha]|uniref:Uncharacterized protein n=1 Tax=Mikania micrantha TaxID=192012 RepID=A0A5N6LA17_9ASTR|nr:hypothetical protein E3N88_45946 [Mikania micrantha]
MGKKSEIRNTKSRNGVQQSRPLTWNLQSAPFWSKFDEFYGWERDFGRFGTRFRGHFDEFMLNRERPFFTYRIAHRKGLERFCTANRYTRFKSRFVC